MIKILNLLDVKEAVSYIVRDVNLLDSALNRVAWCSEDSSLEFKTATILEGIVRNHPYYNGNKRASLQVADEYLKLHGKQFTRNISDFEDSMYSLVVNVASNKPPVNQIAKELSRYIETKTDKSNSFLVDFPILNLYLQET